MLRVTIESDQHNLKYALQLITAYQGDDNGALVGKILAQDVAEEGPAVVLTKAVMGLLNVNYQLLLHLREVTGQNIPQLLEGLGTKINRPKD